VDGAMSCYVFINIGSLDTIAAIVADVFRVLRPGARYAVLDTNPDTTGVEFSTFRNGDPGHRYATGDQRRVLLRQPGADDLVLLDHHWSRDTYLELLASAGFRDLRVAEPLAPGDDPALAGAETKYPPFLIVSGVK
jgi:hypothetical protein